jgi:hypothetical protein
MEPKVKSTLFEKVNTLFLGGTSFCALNIFSKIVRQYAARPLPHCRKEIICAEDS